MISFKPIIRKKKNSDGKTNIKIRFCVERKACYLPTEFYVFPCDFDDKRGLVTNYYPEQGDINSILTQRIALLNKKVYTAHDRLRYMNRDEIMAYFSDKRDYGDIISILKSKAEEKQMKGVVNYSSSFMSTVSAIQNFEKSDKLPVTSVTTQWLRAFEEHLSKNGGSKGNHYNSRPLSVNSVAVYMRNIRTAYNAAISEGRADHNSYPFRDYKIKKAGTGHRVVSIVDMGNIAGYSRENPSVMFARDMFLLSFYLIGINMADLFKLDKIYRDGRVRYIRSKGKHQFDILAQPEALEIIKKYKGTKHLLNWDNYYTTYRGANKSINKYLKQISAEIGAGVPLTTYYARHTWATIASSLDVPDNTISAALGHTRNSMTRIYNFFDNKKIDRANRMVIDAVFSAPGE